MKLPDSIRADIRGWISVILLALIALVMTQCAGYVYAIAVGIKNSLKPATVATGSVTVEVDGVPVDISLTANQQPNETGNDVGPRLVEAIRELKK